MIVSAPLKAELAPSTRLQNSYVIGKQVFNQIADVILLAEEVKHKTAKTDTGLHAEVDDVRTNDKLVVDQLYKNLVALNAPQSLVSTYKHADDVLSQPLQIADSAAKDYPNKPGYQYAESYFAEADSIYPDDHGALTSWIKFKYGADALWAYHLGQFQKSLETLKLKTAPPPLLDIAGRLADNAPKGTPDDIVSCLNNIAMQNEKGRFSQAAFDDAMNAIGGFFGY